MISNLIEKDRSFDVLFMPNRNGITPLRLLYEEGEVVNFDWEIEDGIEQNLTGYVLELDSFYKILLRYKSDKFREYLSNKGGPRDRYFNAFIKQFEDECKFAIEAKNIIIYKAIPLWMVATVVSIATAFSTKDHFDDDQQKWIYTAIISALPTIIPTLLYRLLDFGQFKGTILRDKYIKLASAGETNGKEFAKILPVMVEVYSLDIGSLDGKMNIFFDLPTLICYGLSMIHCCLCNKEEYRGKLAAIKLFYTILWLTHEIQPSEIPIENASHVVQELMNEKFLIVHSEYNAGTIEGRALEILDFIRSDKPWRTNIGLENIFIKELKVALREANLKSSDLTPTLCEYIATKLSHYPSLFKVEKWWVRKYHSLNEIGANFDLQNKLKNLLENDHNRLIVAAKILEAMKAIDEEYYFHNSRIESEFIDNLREALPELSINEEVTQFVNRLKIFMTSEYDYCSGRKIGTFLTGFNVIMIKSALNSDIDGDVAEHKESKNEWLARHNPCKSSNYHPLDDEVIVLGAMTVDQVDGAV